MKIILSHRLDIIEPPYRCVESISPGKTAGI